MNTLYLSGNRIQGSATGKSLFCSIRKEPADLTLTPGEYVLTLATKSPIYGIVLALTPVDAGRSSRSTPAPSALKLDRTRFGEHILPGFGAPASHEGIKFAGSGGPASHEGIKTASTSHFEKTPPGKWGASATIPVSAKAIPGSMCLVVDSGFADLFDVVSCDGSVRILIG